MILCIFTIIVKQLHMKYLIRITALSLLTVVFITSCNEQKNEVAILEQEVIAIHDEAMAKTDSLFLLKKSLQIELAESGDSSNVFDLMKLLDDADEVMMVWMDQYEAPDVNLSKESNLSNLNNQKSKIINVQGDINHAISKTTNYLNR